MNLNPRIGFTGTRVGMTDAQKEKFWQIIRNRTVSVLGAGLEFHHGRCKGADAEAHHLVRRMTEARIVLHPGKSAKAAGPNDDEALDCIGDKQLETCAHFERNRNIVNSVQEIIATPKDDTEQPYGGTWYTIRYARKQGIKCTVIYPDGRIEVTGKTN